LKLRLFTLYISTEPFIVYCLLYLTYISQVELGRAIKQNKTKNYLTLLDALSTLLDALSTLLDATRCNSTLLEATNAARHYSMLPNTALLIMRQLGWQTWPADLAGRLGRQTWPAEKVKKKKVNFITTFNTEIRTKLPFGRFIIVMDSSHHGVGLVN
jgi:hypothetical protein